MRRLLPVVTAAALLGTATFAIADHAAPGFAPAAPLSTAANSGGEGAAWELVTTIPTGNPHTDLDFFTQGGDTFASVGTLAIGPNAGGQTIIRLTEAGEIKPAFVSGAPTAACISDPSAATGLQHDVEAAPKGNILMSTNNPLADRRDAQIIVDATDGRGRCHDQGTAGISGAPLGGLEIIDITDIAAPVEIGLTSHIGQAHTVNIDPKRPHIAFAVSSDSVNVDAEGKRANETSGNSLDGFEVVDMSSCMDFAKGTTVEQKRAKCRPQVYRYRYPSVDMVLGHTLKTAIYGCHETEIYPDDRFTCASGSGLIVFDLKGIFDDNGTPTNYRDDKLRGTPLPCTLRPSSTSGPFATGAMVTDCATNGTVEGTKDLTVKGWLAGGAPSLAGVRHIGSVHHAGRANQQGGQVQLLDSTQDIDFNHESEFTHSGRFLLATDERGGGILAPGATCAPGADVKYGNGGIHAYDATKLSTTGPKTPEEEWKSYAKTPAGDKAIYRAPIRTQPEGTFCTSHVMQQIPGQNRIFMGWYTQGTQVVDYIEKADGTIEFKEAGYFIPENANTWVSHVFKADQNQDGTWTYYGAAADFALGAAGRNAIDIYKVTLPAPPKPLMAAPVAEVGTVTMDINVNRITAGNKPLLSGKVTDKAGNAMSGAKVRVMAKEWGGTTFNQVGTELTTGSDGRFETLVSPRKQTSYGVQVGSVSSLTEVVKVHTRMSIASPTAGSTVGNPVTVTGTLAPADAGGAVGLAERLPDGRFRYLTQTTSDSAGNYRLTYRFAPGQHVLVVYTSARNGNEQGSKSATVTVR